MRKRIYMAQPSSIYGNSVYFPYTVGSLIAFAFKNPDVCKNYTFGSFIYKKDEIEDVVDSLDEPFLVGFSCYLWNYEYNKALAAGIKKRWPTCITVFGGHQICRDDKITENKNVDILQFGEGEECFLRILLAYCNAQNLSDIPNIMFRDNNGNSVFTAEEKVCIPQRVSPYLDGWFDDLLKNESEVSFSAIIETNRGCPNKCAFCDFGNIKAHVRLYDEAMVKSEIEWVSEHQIEFLYIVDANFGLFPRDERFVDYVIKKHKETGYPQKVQASFSKSNPETVFLLNKRINDAGMSKGATLSFQSLSETVLENIYRKNMPLEHFKQLMQLYNENGIAAYSEIILGLPGETYESFRDGLELLLENGQHMSINIFNCELLNNSPMREPEYMERHGIRYAVIEQNQYHIVPSKTAIKEYSRIVVATASMSEEKWIEANILGVFIRAFHNLGLLQCIAIYLFFEQKIPYVAFYENVIQHAKEHPESVLGKLYVWLRSKYVQILNGGGSVTWTDPAFGLLNWPMEESAFLQVIKAYSEFQKEIEHYCGSLFWDKGLFYDLWQYQKAVVKTPGVEKVVLSFEYDWFDYYSDVYRNLVPKLKKCRCKLSIDPGFVSTDLAEYAKNTIWFGRRGSKNICTDIKKV